MLLQKGILSSWKPKFILQLVRNVSDLSLKQRLINAALVNGADEGIARFGLTLLENGLNEGWSSGAYNAFLQYAKPYDLNALYLADDSLDYSIEQLLQIDRSNLIQKHKTIIQEYTDNIQNKKKMIVKLVGEVATSGLRERAKKLKADDDTKRFSVLCNQLIGHESKELENATSSEVERWYQKAVELRTLSDKIEEKIKNLV